MRAVSLAFDMDPVCSPQTWNPHRSNECRMSTGPSKSSPCRCRAEQPSRTNTSELSARLPPWDELTSQDLLLLARISYGVRSGSQKTLESSSDGSGLPSVGTFGTNILLTTSSPFNDDQICLIAYENGRDESPYLLLRMINPETGAAWFSQRGAHELCIDRDGCILRFKRWSQASRSAKLWAALNFQTWEGILHLPRAYPDLLLIELQNWC